MKDAFDRAAAAATRALGSPPALILAAAVVLVWAISGPLFGFSDTWQLIINTGTTVVTFLMVFVIQNAQNRDAKAVHAKLDELLNAIGAATEVIEAEEESEDLVDEEIARSRARASGGSA